jgi:retinol-binding protein 3
MKFILTFLLTFFSAFCFSQSLSVQEIDSLIYGIKKTVNENYVLTDKAKLISDFLQSKNYYQIKTIDSLIKKLNEDFFNIVHDKHLFIQYRPTVAENMLKNKDIHKDQNKKEKQQNYGFEKAKILNDNIGYFKLSYFADAANAKKFVLKYLHRLKETSALIIDLRDNLGGNGSMLELLTGVFLKEGETEILKINYKSGRVVTMKSL